MKRLALVAALVLFSTPAAADARCHPRWKCPTPTPTATPTPTPTPNPTVLFQDDFDGSTLNPVWTTYPWAPNGAVADTGSVYLDGLGHLKLQINDSTQSAGIWTRDTWRVAPPFTAKAWVRFPASYNIWHSFWWNNGTGELDIYENGGLTYRYQAAAHEWNGSAHVSEQLAQCAIDYDPQAAFHVYEARVMSTAVTYLFDGRTCTTLPLVASSFASAGWLNLTHWPENSVAQTGYPSVLTVDRVEVTPYSTPLPSDAPT